MKRQVKSKWIQLFNVTNLKKNKQQERFYLKHNLLDSTFKCNIQKAFLSEYNRQEHFFNCTVL